MHILKFIWQLPQNLLGGAVKILFRAEHRCNYADAMVFRWNMKGGISLGRYIFVPYYNMTTIKHEYGHCIQSKYLGWLYLPVIGLPSIIWAGCFRKFRAKRNISYYDFYTEKLADRLGKVERHKEYTEEKTK